MEPKWYLFRIACTVLSLALLWLSAVNAGRAAPAATFLVTNTNDSGFGSLRWAIEQANDNDGPDLIEFAIPFTSAGCSIIQQVCAIAPASALPALRGGGTTIDGYTQEGAAYATGTEPAKLSIWLKGDLAGPVANGILITSADNVIAGLRIDRFSINGVMIYLPEASGNILRGNHIGVDQGNTFDGVFIGGGASGNRVGGDEPAERNVISANGWDGVDIFGPGTQANVVSGNYIGTDPEGDTAMGNRYYGVRIYGGASNNLVGGDTAGERNLISGNDDEGVRIIGAGTQGNTVSGNYIGVTRTGGGSLGNTVGVRLGVGAQNNVIGGEAGGESNLISGNISSGVVISGTTTMSNTVSHNLIGTDANGVADLGNETFGVLIYGGASQNTIGGDIPAERNIISGNEIGVRIEEDGTAGNLVSGNFIGTTVTGLAPLGNTYVGVELEDGATGNLIGGANATPGGACSGACNLISGNGYGVILDGDGPHENTVSGNYIGTDANGSAALGNYWAGIELRNGTYNLIGGDSPGEGNLISGNEHAGINLVGEVDAIEGGNRISGNIIGLDAAEVAALGNGENGIYMYMGYEDVIGGESVAEGNVISANGECGLQISESNLVHVLNNRIGVDAAGTQARGNGSHGVLIDHESVEIEIGGWGGDSGNLISANAGDGVHIQDGSYGNHLRGNRIGFGADESIDLGNLGNGVTVTGGASDTLIESGNVLLYNDGHGIMLYGLGVTDNEIAQTRIMYSGFNGVLIADGSTDNILGPGNIIHDNPFNGVWITGANTYGNQVTRSSFRGNASAISLEDGSNHGIPAPGITDIEFFEAGLRVIGKARPDDLIEVFGNSDGDGEGEVYLGSAVTDAEGWFAVEIGWVSHPFLTATASANLDGTSEFSAPFANPYRVVFLPMLIK